MKKPKNIHVRWSDYMSDGSYFLADILLVYTDGSVSSLFNHEWTKDDAEFFEHNMKHVTSNLKKVSEKGNTSYVDDLTPYITPHEEAYWQSITRMQQGERAVCLGKVYDWPEHESLRGEPKANLHGSESQLQPQDDSGSNSKLD